MAALLTDSDVDTVSIYRENSEKAWHLFSILLRLGRPAWPAELASMCGLFYVTPDFVEYLCSIPDSPLLLTGNDLVTVSWSAFSAFSMFVSRTFASFVPRQGVRIPVPTRFWDENIATYVRKRKRSRTDLVLMPNGKRRIFLRHNNRDEETWRLSFDGNILMSNQKAHAKSVNSAHEDSGFRSSNMNAIGHAYGVLKGGSQTSHLLLPACYLTSLKNINSLDGENDCEIENDGTQRMLELMEWSPAVSLPIDQHQLPNASIDVSELNARAHHSVGCFDVVGETALLPCAATNSSFCPGTWVENNVLIKEGERVHNKLDSTKTACFEDSGGSTVADGRAVEIYCFEDQGLIDCGVLRGDPENHLSVGNVAQVCEGQKNDGTILKPAEISSVADPSSTGQLFEKMLFREQDPLAECSNPQNFSRELFESPKKWHADGSNQQQQIQLTLRHVNKVSNSHKNNRPAKKDEKHTDLRQKAKRSWNNNQIVCPKVNKADSSCKVPKMQALEQKVLPIFKSFVIEEEEGSGGYGTVYRARRKDDGQVVAVKCPHPKAPSHHVNNELKMLERFGGRNFVIKYEGSFKSGNSECFILEHVEHDRPEVLKREIKVSELQWYGYCMFKALASLHKQGIVHRDVKPGNFLFSRKLNKGYLIDFNLATDLNHKYAANNRLGKNNSSEKFDHVPRPTRDACRGKGSCKFVRSIENSERGAPKESKFPFHEKTNTKNKDVALGRNALTDAGPKNRYRSQGGDASGLTSTRTPSAKRLREPVPYLGRKELISLAQEAMQSPNHKEAPAPASHRKRVAAPPGNVNRSLFHLSPMPLVSGGVPVSGAGASKSRGDGKQKREGPCVGTKGFRAPEVLLKSLHQGPKVDTWSAGVTLLYLIIGRTPFVGDPEHNIKDIAKLKGSEDIWEVAKLHNRESSFPEELLDIQSLPAVDLQDWCEINSRRTDFLEQVPLSLFDLVDKCLAVNPRVRISAEEALRHEFFSPCREALRKQRQLRQTLPES